MEIKIKPWWKSKTILLALVQGLAGLLAAVFSNDPALQTTGIGAVLKTIYDIYLRFSVTSVVTTTPNTN